MAHLVSLLLETSDVHCFSLLDLNILLPLMHAMIDLIKESDSFLRIQGILIK